MQHAFATSPRSPGALLVARLVRRICRWHGGGTALPGLVMERLDPAFLSRALGALPRGVVVVSGTNGKTTTTKITTELLRSQGLSVLTNASGSNYARGVISMLLGAVDRRGRLSADIAVLELDEAHAVAFIEQVPPRVTLLLNVVRDQLDRFTELDRTAYLLHRLAAATTEVVVVNADDSRLGAPEFRTDLPARVEGFGASAHLRELLGSDDVAPPAAAPVASTDPMVVTRLQDVSGARITLTLDGVTYPAELGIRGLHHQLNATAAVALTRAIMGDELRTEAMLTALGTVRPAYGRGEVLTIDGRPCELVLVKNPAGFRMSLQDPAEGGTATMIAINDRHADGRDTSWLWDVDFEALRDRLVAVVTGERAYEMALRLQYDEVVVGTVEPDLHRALKQLLNDYPDRPLRIFATYTCMLALREQLGHYVDIEGIPS